MSAEITMTPEAVKIPSSGSDSPKRPKKSLWTGGIVSGALWDSVKKLNPRTLMKNPVMFVVEVGAAVTTVDLLSELTHRTSEFGFALQITLWLWFTVLFANFAEAMAEGRGKAQAETLRKARSETHARRMKADGTFEDVPGSKLRVEDMVVVRAGEFIPGDGEVVVGVASVDESAITANRRR
jgi:K+-transporting ATPase ATPase B chain